MADAAPGWVFRAIHEDETELLLPLLPPLAAAHGGTLGWARGAAAGLWLHAEFTDEEAAQAFWLALHEQADELGLGLELAAAPPAEWRAWPPEDGASFESAPALVLPRAAAAPAAGLARSRPEIPAATLYDLLRQDDPELDGKLDATIAAIASAGLPVINLLSYLDLPLFQQYAAEHPEEREQNLFLHMLHTWTCYRHFGARHAALPPALAATLADARYLRGNTTNFLSPAPALCLQFPAWWQPLRPAGRGPLQWVKEIYLTHCEPPTPADDRELTLMIVTYDEAGQFGFVPLELPLSLPAVDQSLDAFFAPSLEDELLGPNSQDLRRIAGIAAAYCLYATARDPQRYLS